MALDLEITQDDLYIEGDKESGYNLWIRKNKDIRSVLITESTNDPDKKIHIYSMRAKKYNPINGDEKRLLSGKFLKTGHYSLMDSTPEIHPVLGEAFHIFIPYIVIYGYPGQRNGEIYVQDGTFLNIKAYSKPFADWSGRQRDNPFRMVIRQEPLKGPKEENFMPEAVETYEKISRQNRGDLTYTTGKDDLVDKIGEILDDTKGENLDLVVALDTTKSMEDDIPFVKKNLVPLLKEHTTHFKTFRLGIVLYRDYLDDYITYKFDFTSDMDAIQRIIDKVGVFGGRDIPEAVYEALYEAERGFDWKADTRMIILVGDAPPHPVPRGKITSTMVKDKALELNIEINAIILPQ
ncbi:MAG: VWA domain-containing protein [Spirochaetales bacterium]|nr:VWA domain-containing protein [Spirochaetales bacterium]